MRRGSTEEKSGKIPDFSHVFDRMRFLENSRIHSLRFGRNFVALAQSLPNAQQSLRERLGLLTAHSQSYLSGLKMLCMVDGASESSANLGRVRAWLRSDMRVMRWVFLSLYVLLILGLFGSAIYARDLAIPMMICLTVMFVAQAMFILGAGTIQLCRPIRRRRLLLPVMVSSFMLTVLLVGLIVALMELFKADDALLPLVFWSLVGLSWVFWGVLLYAYAQNQARYQALRRFTQILFAGSLAELLATVPAHLVVIRRPGCLVGLLTMMGICAGIAVMLFSFGPMIVLLFLRPLYRAEKAAGNQFCESCGYDLRASKDRCPECGQPFVASPRTLDLDPNAAS